MDKKCKRCGKEKRNTSFKKMKDGNRSSTCRKCYDTNQLAFYIKTTEQIEKQRQKLLGRKYTLDHRLAISRGQKKAVEEGRHPWKKNIVEHEDSARTRIEYSLWKELLMQRAGGKCERCSSTKRLHAHHKKCFYEFPEIRFSIENGEILCQSCHTKHHKIHQYRVR